jgi:hypothetical protein
MEINSQSYAIDLGIAAAVPVAGLTAVELGDRRQLRFRDRKIV